MPIVAQSEATAIIQGDGLVDYEPTWVQCNILLHPVVIIMQNGDVHILYRGFTTTPP